MTVHIPQARGDDANNEPLKLIEVRPPESDEQFMQLEDEDSPPVGLVVNRPLTTYEEHVLLERFPDAVTESSGFYSDEGQGIITVTIPYATFHDAARLVALISDISRTAGSLQGRARERLYNWEQAAAEVNKALQQ